MDDERAGPKSTRLQRPFGRVERPNWCLVTPRRIAWVLEGRRGPRGRAGLCGGTFLAVGPGGNYTVRWHFDPWRWLRSSLKTRRKISGGSSR